MKFLFYWMIERRKRLSIEEKIYEIIDKHDECGEVDECVDEIESFLSEKCNLTDFKVVSDTDVFDSCGLDIYYIMVAWNDSDGLHLCGDRLTSC